MKPPPDRQARRALEAFEREEAVFVETLRQVQDDGWLADFADRWKRDRRPWAREQQLRYLEHPLNAMGHHPVVKRLYKEAERGGDGELLAAFLVAFDRAVRRVRRQRREFIYSRNWREPPAVVVHESLLLPRNHIPVGGVHRWTDNWTKKSFEFPHAWDPDDRLFTAHTRAYLRRRVWRVLRKLGAADPQAYREVALHALRRYEDDDLEVGENILDSRGLLRIAFGESPHLRFGGSHCSLVTGAAIGDLRPAPSFPAVWRQPSAVEPLLGLALHAGARLVRTWAAELLAREHEASLAGRSLDEILPLLRHADESIQRLGVAMLGGAAGIDDWTWPEWKQLLDATAEDVLELLTGKLREHLDLGGLPLHDVVEMAASAPTPVARLGLDALRARRVATEDLDLLTGLAEPRCQVLAPEVAREALDRLGTRRAYHATRVLPFFDSLVAPVRAAAITWLNEFESPADRDPLLFARLLENPWSDVRLALVEQLEWRSRLPGQHSGDLRPLWATVLSDIQRGSRQKLRSIRQLADAIVRDPALAPELLPVLAIALRSLRAPERRAGLAALVRVVTLVPELESTCRRDFPELTL